jgi:hypothetical protein
MIYFINQHNNFPLQLAIGARSSAQGETLFKHHRPKSWLSPTAYHYRPRFGLVDSKFKCDPTVVISKYNEYIKCDDWLNEVIDQPSLQVLDISSSNIDTTKKAFNMCLNAEVPGHKEDELVIGAPDRLWRPMWNTIMRHNTRQHMRAELVTFDSIKKTWRRPSKDIIDRDDIYTTTFVGGAWRNNKSETLGMPTIFNNENATKMASFSLAQHSIDFHIAHPNFFRSNEFYDIKYVALTTISSDWGRLKSDLQSYHIKMNRELTDLKLNKFKDLRGEDNVQEIYIDQLLSIHDYDSQCEYQKLLDFIGEDSLDNWRDIIKKYKESINF